MESTNYNAPESSNIFNEGGLLDQGGKANLDEAGKWAKFLGIVGLVILGIFLLIGLFAGSFIATIMQSSGTAMPFNGLGGVFFTIYALIVFAIAFYPTFMLYKFGSTIRTSIKINDSSKFNQALLYLKRYFKFIGILTVIMIGLYILLFIFSGLGALIGMGSR